jgi:Uma2 family endonuclease
VLSAEQLAPKRAVPILRTTYHQLAELGAYEGRRVQLINGTVVDVSSLGTPHANAIRVLNRYFVSHTRPELDVMVQLPPAASNDSEPEPDFAFVPRLTGEQQDHPASALLVIEVADSSLRLDLGPKAAVYAQCKVPEYWVIDLAARSTVVHRAPRGAKFASVPRVPWGSTLCSTSLPELSVRLADLLNR